MKKIIKFFLIPFVLFSCSNPIDRKYDESKLEEDMKAIKESGKINEEDARVLAGWLVINKLGDKDLSEKTYQQILDDAKNYKKEQQELEEKAKREESARADKMKKALVVSIYEYKHTPANSANFEFDSHHDFKYAIQNKTDKEIKAIKFHFRIYNSLGDEIGGGYEMSFTDNRIAPLGTFQGVMMFKSNQFSNDDTKLANSKFEDLKFDIIVDKIVYSDGTELM